MSRYNQTDGEIVVCIIPPPQDVSPNNDGDNGEKLTAIEKLSKSSSSVSIYQKDGNSSASDSRRNSLYYRTTNNEKILINNFVRRRSTFSSDRNKSKIQPFRSLGCSEGNLQRQVGSYQEFRRYSSHEKNVASHLSPKRTNETSTSSLLKPNHPSPISSVFPRFKRKISHSEEELLNNTTGVPSSSGNHQQPFIIAGGRRKSVNLQFSVPFSNSPSSSPSSSSTMHTAGGRRYTLYDSGEKQKILNSIITAKDRCGPMMRPRRDSMIPNVALYSTDFSESLSSSMRNSLRRYKTSTLSQSCPNLHLLDSVSIAASTHGSQQIKMKKNQFCVRKFRGGDECVFSPESGLDSVREWLNGKTWKISNLNRFTHWSAKPAEDDESEDDLDHDHCNYSHDPLTPSEGRNRSGTVSNINLHRLVGSGLLHSQSSGGLSRWLFEKQARLRQHHTALSRSFSSQFDRLSIRRYNSLKCTCPLVTSDNDTMTTKQQCDKQSLASRRGIHEKICIKVDGTNDKENHDKRPDCLSATGHGDDPASTHHQLQLPVPFSVVRSISCDTALTEAPTSLMQFKKELGMGVQRKRSNVGIHPHRSTSPVMSRCHSPSCQGGSPGESARTSPNPFQMCNPVQHFRSRIQNVDARRWSLASLPTSGYGTPGSSNLSSQYSSHEHLHEGLLGTSEYVSSGLEDSGIGHQLPSPKPRLRSRSLSGGSYSSKTTGEIEVAMRNNIYKERFPKAKTQMEDNLEKFITSHSRHLSASSGTDQDIDQSDLMPVLSDGSARFVYHQIMELASDCLQKSKEDIITSSYFYDLSQNLDELLQEAKEKSPESISYLTNLARKFLLIVSRPARLLECLEFDPEEFYRFLEEAEGRARDMQKVGDGLPQYIFQKLGLHKEETPTTPNDLTASVGSKISEDSSSASKDEQHYPVGDTNGSNYLQTIRKRPPKEEDFEPIKLISNGAYGSVHLVKHIETGQRFALKKLKKFNLALRNQIDQVYAERDILTFTDNPFVVSFYGSFETKRHLCMVLEYVKGGDCASLLKHIGVFPVEMARMYIAETVLAIEYLHSYGVVHRDLKPDNLLITAVGHIKLTDFGLSKIGLMNRTNLVYEGCLDFSETNQFQDRTICGTPEYIAPEVILRLGYGKPVDWWAVGIILYEFLVGCAPFMGDSPEDLFTHIINDEIEWPEEPYCPPDDAQFLISNLLQKNSLERLGTINGAFEIKVHPFFGNIDWNCLLRRKAEFVPDLENEDDTSYFDIRADRYCHDIESDEEEFDTNSNMFSSFSSYSPRISLLVEENKTPTKNSNKSVSPLSQQPREVNAIKASKNLSCSTSSSSLPCPELETPDSNDSHFPTIKSLDKKKFTKSFDSDRSPKLSRKLISSKKVAPPTQFSKAPPTQSGEAPPTQSFDGKPLRPIPRTRQVSAPSANATSKRTVQQPNLHLVIPNESRPPVVTSPSISPKHASTSSHSPHSSDISPLINQLKPPIFIRKGAKGFGFTIRTIRVYLGQSEYYTMQHIVTAVESPSPAFEAGLRPDDLITHANGESIQNLTHTEVVQKMLGCGDMLTLKVCPLTDTSIRKGESRKSVGKLIRKKGHKQKTQRSLLDKKGRRNSSFRRFNAKRNSTDLKSGPFGPSFQRSFSTSESISSNEFNAEPAKHSPLAYPLTPPRKISPSLTKTDSSSFESNSSPASSVSESGFLGLLQSRPSSLYGLKHKLVQTLWSSGKRKPSLDPPAGISQSPLARTETKEVTSGQSSIHVSTNIPRSPSPLAAGCEAIYATENRRRSMNAVKKTITIPRKSEPDDSLT